MPRPRHVCMDESGGQLQPVLDVVQDRRHRRRQDSAGGVPRSSLRQGRSSGRLVAGTPDANDPSATFPTTTELDPTMQCEPMSAPRVTVTFGHSHVLVPTRIEPGRTLWYQCSSGSVK